MPDASRSWNCAARAAPSSPPAAPPWTRACRAAARKSILPAWKGAHLLWRPHDSLPFLPPDRRPAADRVPGRLRRQCADARSGRRHRRQGRYRRWPRPRRRQQGSQGRSGQSTRRRR
ncbi:hypothetical protein G6F24_017294 [Rhizopus arrhizus]|nr:hypothetical protein G6F24_017294 [Rhizopus arrhizus]